jgi:GYF domain 2
MSDDWYCELGGRQYGPMPLDDLQSKLQGANLRNVFVWCDQYEDWKCAADVPKLNPQPHRPPFPSPAQGRADIQSPPEKKRPGKWKAFGWYILTIGVGLPIAALTRALGPIFWIPSLHVSITWLILAKCKVNGAILPVLAILIGHTSWMLVGFGLLYATKGMTEEGLYFSLDLIVVTGLSIWTLARRSIPSVVGILLYQTVALGNMALAGNDLPVGPAALAMHAVLRVVDIAAAIYAIVAIVRLRRQKAAATS